MGAGGKTDPQKIHITDISKSNNCQLARIIRKRLARMGIKNGVKVVFSSEEKDKNAVRLEGSKIKYLQLARFLICLPFSGVLSAVWLFAIWFHEKSKSLRI